MKNNDYLQKDLKDKIDRDNTYQSTFKVSQTSKIEYLINEGSYDEALPLIDKIIVNEDNYNNWNLKGIILENLSEYEKAVESFNRALALNKDSEVLLNKINCLYKWAKVSYFPDLKYDLALRLIDDALEIIPESEDPSEFYFLKAEVLESMGERIESRKNYFIAYKEFDKLNEFQRQLDYLESTTDLLINITGSYYHNYTPNPGDIVKLVGEPENEHDSDAIAVYLDSDKIGYVANSEYTLFDKVKSASKIKPEIDGDCKAEILFVYLDEYVIAKVI
ncbi:tetratricopeptide repeat protein [Methanobrevibacter sp.]|uniref:tetratricopeptide repeat protein n=1 Tax=Methanobrevibacter sp. TaxID=66852 RepID=UPI0025D46F43|nr:tetratricopeptide repeat protein [Methanobrevibacter sp.]